MIATTRIAAYVYGITTAAVMFMCIGANAAAQAAPVSDEAAVAQLGKEFASGKMDVNGTTLYYVRGGSGPSLILLHGFSQDWYEWRRVMPGLAKRFAVVAFDLRGIGESKTGQGGFDAANLGEDIFQLAQALKLGKFYLVGHDVGAMASYALARLHPEALRGLMIMECPMPGIDPWAQVVAEPELWHINFQQTPELPEILVMGHQDAYFGRFYKMGMVDHGAINEADAAHYFAAYATHEQLKAAFDVYRALPANSKFNASHREPIALPLTLVGGERSFGNALGTLSGNLKNYGWQDVRFELVHGAGHYLPDEKPEQVEALIERYASRN